MDGFKLFTRIEQTGISDWMNVEERETKEWRKITPRFST